MRQTKRALVGLATAGALAFLAGCTTGGGAASTPSATSTMVAGASPSATPTAVASTPSAAGPASIASPEECADVDLIADAKVDGADLSACVIAFTRAAGSGHEYLQAGDASGEVDFVYGDEPAMSGTITDSDGGRSFVLTPTEAWVTFDGEWVRGDAASADSRAVIANTVGEAYRTFADPSVAAGFIASAPSWTVQTEQDTVTLPDGTDVRAWRLQADAPFSAAGGTVNEMIIWLGGGHRVIGDQATVDIGGIQTTTLQQFTRWGEPVKIEVPQG